MRRRTLLAVGTATGVLLAVAGGTVATLRPARTSDGRFTPAAEAMLGAITQGVLGPLLPAEGAGRQTALQAQLRRLEATVAGLPPGMQAEVDELLSLLAHPAGRVGLFGLTSSWDTASPGDVTEALQGLRTSSLALRQQVFHALRDLTNGAYFADPATWSTVGYPGPLPV
jgi:hypothetical protein